MTKTKGTTMAATAPVAGTRDPTERRRTVLATDPKTTTDPEATTAKATAPMEATRTEGMRAAAAMTETPALRPVRNPRLLVDGFTVESGASPWQPTSLHP